MNYWEEVGLHWAYACTDIHPWEKKWEPTYTTGISILPYLIEALKK